MATKQQTVYRLTHHRDFSGITPQKEDIPTPGNREVLIKIRSVALNYRDIVIATGQYPSPVKDNGVPCSDLSGDVFEIGSGVQNLSIGDKVVAAFDPTILYGPRKGLGQGLGALVDGVLREYIVLPAVAVVKVRKGGQWSYGEWASLVCTGVTSWNALFGNVPLKPGQTVLCQGTGGVSITTLILAKAAGATVIVTSSSDEKLASVKEKYGADHTINYKTYPDWASETLRLTSNRGVDFVIENGGSGTIAQSIKSITHGGIIACIGFLARVKQEDMPDVTMLNLGKGAVIRGIQVGSVQMLEDLVRFVGERRLRMPVEREFEFSEKSVREAYEWVKSGRHVGKVVINVV